MWPDHSPGPRRAALLGGLTGALACALTCTLLLVTGCARASSSPAPPTSPAPPGDPGPRVSGGPIPGEPGPDVPLVLRWSHTGGFAGIGGPGRLPDFSLYLDGRVVAPVNAARGRQSAYEYRLTPAAMRRVVAAARTAGLDHPRTVERPDMADAFTLDMTFVRSGRTYRTSIVHPEGSPDDPAVRFWRTLDPRRWPRGEFARDARRYRAQRIAVLAGPGQPAGSSPVRKWPLRPLDGGERVLGTRCTVYMGRDRGTVERLAADAPGEPWRSGDTTYRVTFRPLLPDERGCADLRPRPR
jgi:hypothetical protein